MVSRKRIAALLGTAMLLVGVAACGGDDDDEGADAAPSGESRESDASGSGGWGEDAFPVTVEHEFGETEVPAPPERIVTVGLTEQDTVLALGLTPVGVTEWYGEQPFATFPWAQDELGDAEPEVLSQADGLQYERIAALEPDLILGLNAGLDDESYGRLAQIAPTVAHPSGAEGYFSAWRDQTRLIGQAVGRSGEADAVIGEIDELFASAAEDHPEFEGTSVAFLQNAYYEGQAIAYQEGLSTDFLTDLGFTIPGVLDEYVRQAEGSQAFIPLERLSVLDEADVLLWGTENAEDRAALEGEGVYRALEEVEDGRLVFTDGLTAAAIYFTSPLSLPYALDQLVPAMAGTLAGDGPVEITGPTEPPA
jgi:iron complex transport system substrate-binding protein